MKSKLVRDEQNIRTRTNFELFVDCFPGKGITDIDMAVEHDKGRFLFVEVKHPEAVIEIGQKILLDNLVRKPRVTVAVVWGEIDLDTKHPFISYMRHWGVDDIRKQVDIHGFRHWLKRWFAQEWD